jgi:hypothetical protein
MRLNFFVDVEALTSELNNFKEEAKAALTSGVKAVAASTHAKTIELASQKLNTTRKLYLDNLDFKEVMPNVWVVSLDEPALFLEEGRKSGSMIEDLLKNGAKISKDGHRYKAIPFEHSKPTTQMTPFGRDMVGLIKNVLRREGQTIKGIQRDDSGNPRLGKLGTYHIESPKPTARANTPALYGLNIYQTKQANGKIRRDVMTFRIVSDKQSGKWVHPGREAGKFMDEALKWSEQIWETEILPAIMKRFE